MFSRTHIASRQELDPFLAEAAEHLDMAKSLGLVPHQESWICQDFSAGESVVALHL